MAPPPVALQRYTMRDAAAVDFASVLRQVAAMGYVSVELAGFYDRSPGEVAAFLHLFDALDPEIVAEVDIYWAQVGGVDPAALLGELGDRVALLHVKDGPAEDPRQSMVAVGDGVVDIEGVLAAAPIARWHIV